jgi:hypothetical protein
MEGFATSIEGEFEDSRVRGFCIETLKGLQIARIALVMDFDVKVLELIMI